LLVSVDLSLVFLYLLPLPLQLPQASLILLPNRPLLLFQGRLELRGIFDLLTSLEELGVECLYLLLKAFLLLFLFDELLAICLKCRDR
jgi:hypothetical protein